MSLMSLTAGVGYAATGGELGKVTVAFDRWDGGRPQYRYVIETDAGTRHDATDLRGSNGGDIDLPDILATLLSFLSACAESIDYAGRTGHGDNVDLFPASLHDWIAGVGSDVFSLAADELRAGDDR